MPIQERRTNLELNLHLESCFAQLARNLVELLLREHPLFFRNPAHRTDVHRWSQLRRHHYRRERLIYVQHHDLGRELQGKLLGVAQREIRIFGEIGGG